MKKFILLFVGILMVTFFVKGQSSESNMRYVDPTIGGVGRILQPTRPVAHLPNSVVRVFPMRHDQLDDQIWYFPLTVASYRLKSVFALMPVAGAMNNTLWGQRSEYAHEITTPYYYSCTLEEDDIRIEFSPQSLSGFYKFRFSDHQDHYFRLGIIDQNGKINVFDKRVITGTEVFSGMKAYFYGIANTDITDIKYRNAQNPKEVLIKVGEHPQEVSFRYGISFISIEQAKKNLEKEIPDWNFETVKRHAFNQWDQRLSQINVEGGTPAQKRVFYTALYRAYARMVNINEYGKYYSAYDHKVHESTDPFFVDNWIWDLYIAEEPLYMILNPDLEVEKIKSYITMSQQNDGWMPSFALVFGDWPAMTGNYAACWMADAWAKGIRNFDIKAAYRALKKKSLKGTLLPWRNGPETSLDSFYDEHGYMPGLYPGQKETVKEVDTPWERRQAVSVTLTNSYCDWCIAQFASVLNKPEDRKLFMERAGFYKNVFRKDKGFMWPKDDKGNWIEPYNPKLADRAYFTENNAYIFNWAVKHDLEGLFNLMGGRQKAKEKLDHLFRASLGLPKFKFWNILPDASGLVGQFQMGNEPSLHIPYLYDYVGAPWRTQKRIRMLLKTWFPDNVFGMPGDEDGGAMSSWVVFSMMGFYQVTQGIPVYTIGSPVFDKISISLPNGKKFQVIAKNNSRENKYIQSAFLNGKPLDKPWFTHDTLMKGGVLKLIMGSEPNKEWGSAGEAAPPSFIDYTVPSKQ